MEPFWIPQSDLVALVTSWTRLYSALEGVWWRLVSEQNYPDAFCKWQGPLGPVESHCARGVTQPEQTMPSY